MVLAEIRRKMKPYGYGVGMWRKDPFRGKLWRYYTFPLVSGAYGYFETKGDLVKYLREMDKVRAMLA